MCSVPYYEGDQLRVLRMGADIIVATPGRLNDFLAPPPGMAPCLFAHSVPLCPYTPASTI